MLCDLCKSPPDKFFRSVKVLPYFPYAPSSNQSSLSDEQEKVAKHSGSCCSVVLFSVLLHNPLPSSDIPLETVSHHTCFCSTKHFSSLKVLKSSFFKQQCRFSSTHFFFFLRSTHSGFKQLERILKCSLNWCNARQSITLCKWVMKLQKQRSTSGRIHLNCLFRCLEVAVLLHCTYWQEHTWVSTFGKHKSILLWEVNIFHFRASIMDRGFWVWMRAGMFNINDDAYTNDSVRI